jgi:hypothetical protein
MKFGILDFMMASLQVAFIVMKLCGAISWSWWLVMLPILLAVVFNVLVLLFVCIKLYKSHLLFKQYGTDNKLAIRLKKMQQEREKLEREMSQFTTTKQ